MAIQQNPNDPYRPEPTAEDTRSSARLDQEFRAETDRQSPVTGGRVAALAAAVVVALGLVYYGMNSTATGPNEAVNVAPTTTQTVPQSTASGSVAPNSAPGTTTGSAPAQPAPATPGSNGAMNNPGAAPATR